MGRGSLIIEFAHQRMELHSGDPGVVFGRGADIDIDSNPFLHRQVGRIRESDGIWWIENLSRWTTLSVSSGGTSALLTTADDRVAVVHVDTRIRFGAGPCNYELRLQLADLPGSMALADAPDLDSTATLPPGEMTLTDDHRLLVLALAEDQLRAPLERHVLPSNAEIAARLEWTRTKFNRKLDNLCRRLDQMGVDGVRAIGRRTNERRNALVDYMIANHYVCADDLVLLPPRPAGSNSNSPNGSRTTR